MTITVEKPEIITLLYRQEKTDADYGSCMWARFYFDTKNYTLSIESDCGNYSHGWLPTQEHESFLHLCARFDAEYLLYKISEKTVVKSDATWKAVKDLLEEIVEYSDLEDELDEYAWNDIESACYHCRNQREVYDSIMDTLNYTRVKEKVEFEDLWGAIEMDYPANAKKIFSVFTQHIQPFIKSMEVQP